jgi:hypothetical protein
MKRFIPILALVLGTAALSPAASATTPVFIPPSLPPDLLIADECPFPVLVHTVVDQEVVRIFDGGRVTITGTATRQFTNLDNGKSEQFVVSGTEFFTPNPDGTTTARLEGLHMPSLPPGFPGQGFLWITAGPVVAELDADGNVISISRLGSAILHDVCAELA